MSHFPPDQLHVVTCVSNPSRWQSRTRLMRNFVQHMLDSKVSLTVVECSLGHTPFEFNNLPKEVNYVPVRHKTIVWHKESLINIGLHHLPPDAQNIAWIDADIEFEDPHWVNNAIHALQQYPIIQPWTQALDLGPNGRVLDINLSFGGLYQKHEPIELNRKRFGPKHNYKAYHTGYAWCARRAWLEAVGGLLDFAALGSSDHNMAFGLMGRILETDPKVTPEYTAALLAWQQLAMNATNRHIGAIQGVIRHQFHGPKSTRGYNTRPEILRRAKFNPVTDLKYNLDRVIELTGNKPQLTHEIESYFSSRNEDANVV